MTFFLSDQPGPIQIKAQRTDQPLPSLWGGISASFQKEQLESNANFRHGREVIAEEDTMAVEAAKFMGAERIKPYVDAFNERARASGMAERQMPEDLSELPDIFGPNFSKQILEDARNDPEWSGPDVSDEAVEKRINERLKKEHSDLEETIAGSNGGALASFAGAIAGGIADVRNLPFLLAGGGTGSFARIMGREAMANMGAEALMLPDRFDMAKRLDLPEPDVRMALTYAAIGGAAFGGAVEGLARGVHYWRGTRVGRNADRADVPRFEQEMNVDVAEDALTSARHPFDGVKRDVVETRRSILDDVADASPLSGIDAPILRGERQPIPFDDWVRGPVSDAGIRIPRSLIPDEPQVRTNLPVEQITARATAYAEQREIDTAARQIDPEAFSQSDALGARVANLRRFISELTKSYDDDLTGSIKAAQIRLGKLRDEALKTTKGKNAKAKVRQEIRKTEADLLEMRGLQGRAHEAADIVRTRSALTDAETKLRELGPRLNKAREQVAPPEFLDLPKRPSDPVDQKSYDEAIHEYEMARQRTVPIARALDEELYEFPPTTGWTDMPAEREAMLSQKSADLRDAGGTVDLGDGRGARSIEDIMAELDADDDFADIVALCGRRTAA